MLTFLPHGTTDSRVGELRACARTRFEMEALAIEKYEHDVVGYRAYALRPQASLDERTWRPDTQPRRSMV